MLKKKASLTVFFVCLTDVVLLIMAFFTAFEVRDVYFSENHGHLIPLERYLWLIYPFLLSWFFLLYYFDIYKSQGTQPFWKEIGKIGKSSFFVTLFLMSAVFAFKADYISRLFITFSGAIGFLFLVVERSLLRTIVHSLRKMEYNDRNVLIVGTGQGARELAEVITQSKHWGLNLIGFISDHSENKIERILRSPILGDVADLPKILRQHIHVIDELIFTISRKRLEEMEETFLLCEEQGVRTHVAMNFFPNKIAKVYLEDMNGIPLLTFTTTPHNTSLLMAKRFFDIFVAATLLVATSPIFLLIGLLIKIMSEGPIFFCQVRIGLNGRKFTLYKFRSMLQNAETMKGDVEHLNEMNAPLFKIKNDPRTTAFGRFLRRVSLDEFPQLYNVLLGDMSLVGPRPPLPEEVAQYEPWQRRRLSMKPGLTCLWQVNGRNKIVDFKKWVEMDLHYIDNWSLKLDFKIFIKTIFVVLSGRGAS